MLQALRQMTFRIEICFKLQCVLLANFLTGLFSKLDRLEFPVPVQTLLARSSESQLEFTLLSASAAPAAAIPVAHANGRHLMVTL